MSSTNKKHIFAYTILSLALVGAIVFGVYKRNEAADFANEIKMDYQRCFTELVQYTDDLQTNLEKSQFVNDPRQMIRLSGEIYRQAAEASANLGLLPLRSEPFENLSEFFAQAGNYAHSLSFKMLDGKTVTEEEYKNLYNLSRYASKVASALDKDLEDLYNGTLDISRVGENAEVSGLDKVLGEIEDQLHDYPALIYDGPFSSHLTDRKSVFLQDKGEITKEDAMNKASMLAGDGVLLECVEEGGNVPAYYFYDKDNKFSIAITKQGGYLLSYLNNREIGESVKNIADAKNIGRKFLEESGFSNLKESYYETVNDTAVINYAATQDGYILYPDLVKVKVALDTGEVVGCETRGYIMYHKLREIPQIKVSQAEAVSKINPNVTVGSVTLAVIPQDGGSEAFTWQIEGKINNTKCLIYVNTQTGAEEKLFLLIESETGVLAV